MDANGSAAGLATVASVVAVRPGCPGAYPNRFRTISEAGDRVRIAYLRTPIRRPIIEVIAQLSAAEIAPLVTTPETVYDHRG